MSTNSLQNFCFTQDKLGKGEVVYAWQPGDRILAFCGENRVVSIVDKMGIKQKDFPLKFNGKCKSIEFDTDGDTIATIQDRCSIVTVINIFTNKTLDLEINRNNKDFPTCIKWAKNSHVLFIGTNKGLIYFYSKKNDKITPVSMSHSKSIISADWNEEGNLATSDENKTLSVTNMKGEALLQNAQMKAEPRMLRWARQKTNDSKVGFTTISTIQDNKTILIYDFKKKNSPIELALDSDYGNIVTYQWFGDGYIAIGFSKGFITIVSTHMTEIKNEISNKQIFKNGLDDLAVCDSCERIAVAGENSVVILDKNTYEEIKEEKIELPTTAGRIAKIAWSNSGQIIVVSTFLGFIFAFNVVVSETFAINGNLFSTLVSINEVATYEFDDEDKNKKNLLYTIKLSDEPRTFVVSDDYFVVSYGTKLEVYRTRDEKGNLLSNKQMKGKLKDFNSSISMIALNNNFMSVLNEGKIHLINLNNDNTEKIFPLKETDDVILYAAMTEEYLSYSDSNGRIKVYSLMDNDSSDEEDENENDKNQIKINITIIGEYKFDNNIKKIFPNEEGTKYICISEIDKGFLYLPVTETIIPLDDIPKGMNKGLWDQEDQNVFIISDKNNTLLYTFCLVKNSLQGPYVKTLKEVFYLEDLKKSNSQFVTTSLKQGSFLINLNSGLLNYFDKNSKELKNLILNSHYWLFNWRREGDNEDGHKKYFMQNYQLLKYNNSIQAGKLLDEKDQVDYFEELGREALKNLNIEAAENAFRLSNNISLVLTVEQLKNETENKILLGNIAAILGEEDLAQELFIESSTPEKALDLRMDLQDWSIALKLAKEYNENKVPFISRKLAYQNETQNNVSEAINLYETSYISNPSNFVKRINDEYDINDLEFHNQQCTAGISRCAFRIGDTEKGLNKAKEINDKNLIIEIANLCETLNYGLESAKLYSQVGLFERAAQIYIKLKLFKSAEDLMDKIKSPKLLVQMAKMKESEKLYSDAEKAYIAAQDWENAIRINLKFLDNPKRAHEILMKNCKTETAAILMSQYYESKGMKKETIEYKLIARKYEEAFAIAQSYGEMKIYSNYLLENFKNIDKYNDEFKKIALYYEGRSDYGNAGVFYEKVGEFSKASKMYIKSNDPKFLDKAVEMVGKIKDEKLIAELIDYFLVESKANGNHYLTRLYILLGDYKQACDIAITLASEEQKTSKYSDAHQILLDSYIGLKEKNLPVSYELNHKLAVLHSYKLAKKLIKLKQSLKAARNLLRIANNITMFEEDKAKIITTVVIECQEAKLTKSAASWAIEIMKDNKNGIPEKYLSRIDKISRKAYRNEEEPLPMNTPCPYCKKDVPEYDLECKSCYNVIPFCIASGKHIVLANLGECSNCHFPFNIEELKELLVNEVKCPMCECEIDPRLVEKIDDPFAYIKTRKVATGTGK